MGAGFYTKSTKEAQSFTKEASVRLCDSSVRLCVIHFFCYTEVQGGYTEIHRAWVFVAGAGWDTKGAKGAQRFTKKASV